jgi:hypothetical protein
MATHAISHNNQRTRIAVIIVSQLGNHEGIFLVVACAIDLIAGYIEFYAHYYSDKWLAVI